MAKKVTKQVDVMAQHESNIAELKKSYDVKPTKEKYDVIITLEGLTNEIQAIQKQ